MQIILSPDMLEFLDTFVDVNTDNMSMPETVVKIKDLSNVNSCNWTFLNHNSYIAVLQNGKGLPFTCPKEEIGSFLSALKEDGVEDI